MDLSSTAPGSFASAHLSKPLPLLEEDVLEKPSTIYSFNARDARFPLLPTPVVTATSALPPDPAKSPSSTKCVISGNKGPYSVYVGNLPPRTTEKALNSVLADCGIIAKIALHRKKGHTDVSHAFIDFTTLDGATSAVKLRDVYLHGKRLTIQLAANTTNSGSRGSRSQKRPRVRVDATQRWKKNEERVVDALQIYLDSVSDEVKHDRIVETLKSASRRLPRPVETTSDHGPINLSGAAPIAIRSLAQMRAERQESTLCADEDGERTSDYFNESFDGQGGGESDSVHWVDWDEDEEGEDEEKEGAEGKEEGEKEGEGEEKGKEKEENVQEEEKEEKVEGEKEEEVTEEKAESEGSDDVDGEAGIQMTLNRSNNFPDLGSTTSATIPETDMYSPAHSDGKGSCAVALVDSPTHSTSSLSDGSKQSLVSSVSHLTPRQEGTPSSVEQSRPKKSPMARYQAMAALILSSASDRSVVSEAEQAPALNPMPPSNVSLGTGVGVTEEVSEVQRCSKTKKAKKVVTLAAQFGSPQPQVAKTGPLPFPALPPQASPNSGCAPKQSVSKEPSAVSTISSQGSRKPATKPRASYSTINGMVQATEGEVVGSTSDDSEVGIEDDSGKKQWAKWQCQLTALKASLSETVAFNKSLLQKSKGEDAAHPSTARLCEVVDDTCRLQLSILHKTNEVDARSHEWQRLLQVWSRTPSLDYDAMEEEIQLLQELEATRGSLEAERLRQALLQQAVHAEAK